MEIRKVHISKIEYVKVSSEFTAAVLGFPNEEKDSKHRDYHNQFEIGIYPFMTDNGKSAKFDFYGSSADYHKRLAVKRIFDKDLSFVVQCIFEDSLSGLLTFEDFCSEFGYDSDSRSAERIHKQCIESYQKLHAIGYTEEILRDIVNFLIECENNNQKVEVTKV